jgi:hypothetical protein
MPLGAFAGSGGGGSLFGPDLFSPAAAQLSAPGGGAADSQHSLLLHQPASPPLRRLRPHSTTLQPLSSLALLWPPLWQTSL